MKILMAIIMLAIFTIGCSTIPENNNDDESSEADDIQMMGGDGNE